MKRFNMFSGTSFMGNVFAESWEEAKADAEAILHREGYYEPVTVTLAD